MTPKKLYGLFSVGEAITWALLISALISRALGDLIPNAVTIAGSIHGAMFLSYCTTAVLVGVNQRWKFGKVAAAVSLAIVPFATVPWDRRLLKENALEGSWRVAKSDHPGDAGWFDSLFRWFIARPVLLVITLIAAVAVIFTVLLSLGSPTTWFN